MKTAFTVLCMCLHCILFAQNSECEISRIEICFPQLATSDYIKLSPIAAQSFLSINAVWHEFSAYDFQGLQKLNSLLTDRDLNTQVLIEHLDPIS